MTRCELQEKDVVQEVPTLGVFFLSDLLGILGV